MSAIDVVLEAPPALLVLGASGLVAALVGLGRHPWVVAWTLIAAVGVAALSPGQRAAASAAWRIGSPVEATRCMALSLSRADVWLGREDPTQSESCRAPRQPSR